VRDFYCAVVGWTSTDHDMGDYADFNIHCPESGRVVAGICHARGMNAKIPPQWLVYLNVEDVDRSVARCVELGGKVHVEPRNLGSGRMCVIEDPAGAVCALWGPVSPD
jgi:predicted enzyme related to lactoylglutathione lyase